MTPDQIAAVDASVVRLAPVLDAVAGDFYARMFLAAPEVDSLFTCPPAHQRAVFVAELRQIAHLVRHHDDFVHEARELGRRHGGYGVRAAALPARRTPPARRARRGVRRPLEP